MSDQRIKNADEWVIRWLNGESEEEPGVLSQAHLAGQECGYDQAIREVVIWLRSADKSNGSPDWWNRIHNYIADAIEHTFLGGRPVVVNDQEDFGQESNPSPPRSKEAATNDEVIRREQAWNELPKWQRNCLNAEVKEEAKMVSAPKDNNTQRRTEFETFIAGRFPGVSFVVNDAGEYIEFLPYVAWEVWEKQEFEIDRLNYKIGDLRSDLVWRRDRETNLRVEWESQKQEIVELQDAINDIDSFIGRSETQLEAWKRWRERPVVKKIVEAT